MKMQFDFFHNQVIWVVESFELTSVSSVTSVTIIWIIEKIKTIKKIDTKNAFFGSTRVVNTVVTYNGYLQICDQVWSRDMYPDGQI